MGEKTAVTVAIQLEKEIIEPSLSDWARPVVIMARHYGELRFWVENRFLNDSPMADTYPIPSMDDLIDSLGD